MIVISRNSVMASFTLSSSSEYCIVTKKSPNQESCSSKVRLTNKVTRKSTKWTIWRHFNLNKCNGICVHYGLYNAKWLLYMFKISLSQKFAIESNESQTLDLVMSSRSGFCHDNKRFLVEYKTLSTKYTLLYSLTQWL